MRLVGCIGGLVLVAIGLAAGCLQANPQNRRETVCTAYCECFIGGGGVEECVQEDCLPDLPPVSDDCYDCVVANASSCSTLDAQCTDICVGQP